MRRSLLAAALLGLILPVQSGAAVRPNIVFILADALGFGDLRCYNDQSKVPTPQIDRLAREGMRFHAERPEIVKELKARLGMLRGTAGHI